MGANDVLLVGTEADALADDLSTGGIQISVATDVRHAAAALDETWFDAVLIHERCLDRRLRLLRAAFKRSRGAPILVALSPGEERSREDLMRQGASDVLLLSYPPACLLSQVRGWCHAGRLAHTEADHRAALERQLLGQMRTREELRLVREQLEALLACGLVMYSTEPPAESGGFSTAAQLEASGFTHLDSSVLSLVGHTAEELMGGGDTWKRLLFEKDRRRLAAKAKRLMSSGQHACHYRIRHADGRLLWISDEARLLRQDDGRGVVVVGCLRDVTEKRKAPGVSLRGTGMLQRAQRMDGVQRLAGTVAHDFNNMLAIMMCHAQFASKLLPGDHAAQKGLDCILEAAIRAKGSTKLLVQLSQRNNRREVLVNINATIRDTVKLVAPLFGAGVQLSTHLRPGMPRVRMDRLDLEHVILNLCVNARDAMPAGGTLAIVSDLKPPGREAGQNSPLFVVVEVTDTGDGMDDDVMKRCFEPFFTTKSQGEGSGLGLFNVLQTVNQCGGAVAVETEAGRGTTIRLLLPAVERRERPRVASTQPRKSIIQDAPAERLAALRGARAAKADPAVRAEMPTPPAGFVVEKTLSILKDPPRE